MKYFKNTLFLATYAFSSLIFGQNTIAGGSNHSLFICNNGNLISSGRNDFGQLGDGTANNRSVAASVVGQNNIKSVAAANHTLIVKKDGTVWSCGENWSGQLGLGKTALAVEQPLPTKINNLSNVKSVACGAAFSLFLLEDGTVYSCGSNGSGQLGNGSTSEYYAPKLIENLSGITKIAAGDYHSLFLKNDGTVWACGQFYATKTPTQISELTNITDIAAGNQTSLFVKSDGTVYGQYDIYGRLAGASITSPSPHLSGITKVAVGRFHCLYLKNDGTVYAAGANDDGQLGDGTFNFTDSGIPVKVSKLTGITEIASGSFSSFFKKNDGTFWACGSNSYGVLGDGSDKKQNIPVLVGGSCISTAAVENLNNDFDISVYPNPSNGSFTIDWKGLEADVVITNINGQLIKSTKIQNNLTFDSFEKGIYFITIRNEENSTTKTLTIN